MSLPVIGDCCGPCWGGPFLARQIQATVPWYGSTAFAGGLTTTLWLVETHITAYTNLVSTYGAGWVSATRTYTNVYNQWTGVQTPTTSYSPDEATFNARAALEPGPPTTSQVVITSNSTVLSFDIVLASNPSEIHCTDSDVYTSPVTQANCLTNAHSLIDSYISGSPGSFAPLPFSTGSDGLNALLSLSYNSGGSPVASAGPFAYTFPSGSLSALPIAAYEPLASGAVAGDAVVLSIGQIFASDNFWDFFVDLAADPAADCNYHCNPSGDPAVLYSPYLLPASPGQTWIIADPGRNYSSPCDGSPPPTC